MWQPPGDSTIRSSHSWRTQARPPGMMLPTTPVAAEPPWYNPETRHWQQRPPKKRPLYVRRAAWRLFFAGFLLSLLYFALYPLLADSVNNNAMNQMLTGVFPWLPRLYWTNWAPLLVDVVSRLPLFNIRASGITTANVNGFANLLLSILGLSFLIVLLAASTGRRLSRQLGDDLQSSRVASIYVIVLFFTLIFAVLFFFAPGGLYTDVFLYGLYGRIITIYHANPYIVSPHVFSGDPLHAFLPAATPSSPLYGPLWIDMTIPVALLARESVTNVLLGFRLLAAVFHLVNVLLLWAILARLKPEKRITGTLLYAWNPLVLLLGVSEMHVETIVITFLLLSVLFWQRRLLLLGWSCMLLATLLSPFCALLLPLFLRLFVRDARGLSGGRATLAWLGLLVFSTALIVLIYVPYWPGLGVPGILANLGLVFVQNTALHSLAAAVSSVAFTSMPSFVWLTTPFAWMVLTGFVVGCLLLLGLWMIDNLESALLFASWIFLVLFMLLPTNWPWYMLIPLALGLASGGRRTAALAVLLVCGAALEYYFGLWNQPWMAQGLLIIGLPLLLWGWTLFFTSAWGVTHRAETDREHLAQPLNDAGFSRISWSALSRPSWPGGWRR